MPHTQHGLLENADNVASLAERASLHVRYSAGEMICQVGTYVAGIHFIRCGAVSNRVATLESGSGRSCILGPGDLIGLEILLGNGHALSMSQLRALTDVGLDFLSTDELRDLLAEDAAVARDLIGRVASQYFRMQRLLDVSTSDEDVICDLLLQIATACGCTAETGRVTLPRSVDRTALCDLSGLSPRRLRRVLDDVEGLHIGNADVSFDPEDVRSRLQHCPGWVPAARASLP